MCVCVSEGWDFDSIEFLEAHTSHDFIYPDAQHLLEFTETHVSLSLFDYYYHWRDNA